MSIINEEVHLSREPLTAHAKDAALPRNKEVRCTGGLAAWGTRQMYLLCIIEAVVHPDLTAAGSTLTNILQLELGTRQLRVLDHLVVVVTCEVHDSQMFLSDTSQYELLCACCVSLTTWAVWYLNKYLGTK